MRKSQRLALVSSFAVAILAVACEEPKDCGPCNDAEGTQFCVTCNSPDLCTASIENEETGEVLFSCDEAPGESCATDELVARCPDT